MNIDSYRLFIGTAFYFRFCWALMTTVSMFSMQAQADALGQVAGGPAIGAIAKFISLPVALIVSALALLPAIGLYRRALKIEEE